MHTGVQRLKVKHWAYRWPQPILTEKLVVPRQPTTTIRNRHIHNLWISAHLFLRRRETHEQFSPNAATLPRSEAATERRYISDTSLRALEPEVAEDLLESDRSKAGFGGETRFRRMTKKRRKKYWFWNMHQIVPFLNWSRGPKHLRSLIKTRSTFTHICFIVDNVSSSKA